MKLKIVQVNIYRGKFLNELVNFLEEQKPDFICAQEVTGGSRNLFEDKTINLFEYLRRELKVYGVYNHDFTVSDKEDSFQANAVFSKFPIVGQEVLVLKQHEFVKNENVQKQVMFKKVPRHVLDAIVAVEGFRMHIMSWHGAWTAPPSDDLRTLGNAQLVVSYIKSLGDQAFILCGDLNNIIGSKTVGLIETVANNLMLGEDIKQTTHPKIHKIVPRGYLVDYIFTSKHFLLKRLEVPEVTVSDHLPVVAELSFSS